MDGEPASKRNRSSPATSQVSFDLASQESAISDVRHATQEELQDTTEETMPIHKITKGQAWQILRSASNQAEAAENTLYQLAGVKFVDLSMEELTEFTSLTENLKKRFGRLRDTFGTRNQKTREKEADITWLNISVEEELKEFCAKASEASDIHVYDEQEVASKPDAAPGKSQYRKPLDELKDVNTIHARTDEALQEIVAFCEANEITRPQGLGYLLHRSMYSTNKKVAHLGMRLYNKEEVHTVAEVEPELALHIVERLQLGRSQYTNTRLVLIRHVIFPAYQYVSSLRLEICPELTPYPIDSELKTGVFACLKEGVQKTMDRAVEKYTSFIPNCCGEPPTCCTDLIVKVHISADGRGDEKQYQQRTQLHLDTSHAISVYFSVPSLHIPRTDSRPASQSRLDESGQSMPNIQLIEKPLGYKKLDEAVWRDPTPAAHRSQRPWVLTYGRENRETVDKLMKDIINPQGI